MSRLEVALGLVYGLAYGRRITSRDERDKVRILGEQGDQSRFL